MASFLMNRAIAQISADQDEVAQIRWDQDTGANTVKLMLATSIGSVARNSTNTIEEFGNLGMVECTATNYAAGGNELVVGSRSIATTGTNPGTIQFNGPDVTFSNISGGAAVTHAILYRNAGTDATKLVIAVFDIADTLPNGNDLTISWTGGTCFKITN